MKKFLAVLLVLVLALTMVCLTACGGNDEPQGEDIPVYTAVTEATFPPFDTTDDKGNFCGFDKDLMDAIGEDQGFKVEYSMIEFDALIPAVESDQADIITAGMTYKPERADHVLLSDAYYDSAVVLMVAADSNIKSIDDLTSNMTVSAQLGTSSGDFAQECVDDGTVGKYVANNEFTLCAIQLANGDVDAVFMDKPCAEYLVAKYAGQLEIVGEPMNSEQFVFGVTKKNPELMDKINAGLKNMIENGTYDALIEKWFGEE